MELLVTCLSFDNKVNVTNKKKKNNNNFPLKKIPKMYVHNYLLINKIFLQLFYD